MSNVHLVVTTVRMATGDAATVKKRPRVDLLASLDAAFATKKDKPASKYTSQATAKEAEATNQQAYLHTKRKKKSNSARNGDGRNQQQQHGNSSSSISGDKRALNGRNHSSSTSNQPQPLDPVYGKLNLDILSVGLRNCSLVSHCLLFKYEDLVKQGEGGCGC